ncbi:MAG: response regulator transcription factor [Muribaculaceae bacterium]|nr:response regulator transcription factor [Muribaculaceae bacterium]
MRIRILVIDDEESICEILKYNLEKEGWEVDCYYSAEEALRHDLSIYSICIVDIMMERLSGFDFVKRMKYEPETERIPIILCSAMNGEDHKVMGLNIGADDYVTKPFNIPEVIARIKAVLRRYDTSVQPRGMSAPMSKNGTLPDLTFKALRVDRNEKSCYCDGLPVKLTRTEYDLLVFFLTHRNHVYSRDEIIKEVWPDAVQVTKRTVDVNLARLRRKIDTFGQYIETRVGFGYGFNENI